MEIKNTHGLLRDLDLTLQPRPAPRYKVWLPLATQQLRLRSLCQIIGFNLEMNKTFETCWFYFTLHRSSMSSPLYTSEPIDNMSPKWSSLEVPTIHATGLSTANEIILRLWRRTIANDPTSDVSIFTWGISFTGLVYLGPKLSNNLESMLRNNSLIFHLHGGYFVPSYCLQHPPEFRRYLYMSVNNSDICESYTVTKLTNLRSRMQSLKQKTESVQLLRERIASGESVQSPKFKQTTLSRLLEPKRISKEKKAEILKIRKELEVARFRTKLLEQERIKKVGELRALNQLHLRIIEENDDQRSLLMEKYRELNKDIERLRDWRQSQYIQTRERYVQTSAQLAYRKYQLISDLNVIYPIRQEAEGKFTINNVHLPDSEELATANDLQISVALGFVAQVTEIVANCLNISTRYPIIHQGSKSEIVDHIKENLRDKDRKFPLFSRSKDKLRFHYGVYLLNKNVAQLRWYCGLPTGDLRATLPNLASLINLKPNPLDSSKRTFSGSSLDTDNSNNGKHSVPLTPPLQKVLINKDLKGFNRTTRTMSQFRSSKSTLGSSLDQGLDKPLSVLVLGEETKRICKSEESAIDDKTFSLPRSRHCNSSEETVYDNEIQKTRIHVRPESSPEIIARDIEITIPTSVYNSRHDGTRSGQRSSNSISSCEMALTGSQNDVVERLRDSPNGKVINSTNEECVSPVTEVTIESPLIQSANSSIDSINVKSSESSMSMTSVFENTDKNKDFLSNQIPGKLMTSIVNSNEKVMRVSAMSLNDGNNYCQRSENMPEIASSCPESAKSFYDDGEEEILQKNWRTENNSSLETPMSCERAMNVSLSQSQPSNVQEALNEYRASTEFINSIRRSSENVFARTEALASKKTSFKVMKPRS